MFDSPNRFAPLRGLGNNSNPSKRKKIDDFRVKRLGFGNSALQSESVEKYLIIKHETEGCDLSRISPFGIQKALDMITTGIAKTQRTRSGELLLLTKNKKATEDLLKAKNLGGLAPIIVKEHATLNNSQGIIFCRDLMQLTDDELKAGFKEQGVVEVRRIKKWVDKKLTDTAAIVLTFNNPTIPETIKAGYIVLNVKLFIPNPMKCTNCLRFGHTKKRCNNKTVCMKCSEVLPHTEECTKLRCINCGEQHTNNSKECQVYKRETEIIKIKTVDRLTFFEAKTKYYRMYANTTSASKTTPTFADTLKQTQNQNLTQTTQQIQTTLQKNQTQQPTLTNKLINSQEPKQQIQQINKPEPEHTQMKQDNAEQQQNHKQVQLSKQRNANNNNAKEVLGTTTTQMEIEEPNISQKRILLSESELAILKATS